MHKLPHSHLLGKLIGLKRPTGYRIHRHVHTDTQYTHTHIIHTLHTDTHTHSSIGVPVTGHVPASGTLNLGLPCVQCSSQKVPRGSPAPSATSVPGATPSPSSLPAHPPHCLTICPSYARLTLLSQLRPAVNKLQPRLPLVGFSLALPLRQSLQWA